MHGYNAEPTKSWLIVKPDLHEQVTRIFEGTGVNITTRGKKHLGAVIGEFEHKHEFITDLVDRLVKQINMLTNIAALKLKIIFTFLEVYVLIKEDLFVYLAIAICAVLLKFSVFLTL